MFCLGRWSGIVKWESVNSNALHLNRSNNSQCDAYAVTTFLRNLFFKNPSTFSHCTISRLSTTLALIKPSYRWNTTLNFIYFVTKRRFLIFFSSIGVDATSEGNQTNLSFSAREHLPWCTLKALQTPRCYTGACYKSWPQGTSGSPGWNGPFAPSVLSDPQFLFSFKRNNTPSFLTRKG